MPNIIDRALHAAKKNGSRIELKVDRLKLAKRRWQGAAEDGEEFGFDLAKPLQDGQVIFETETAHYVLSQEPEPVLEVALGETLAAAHTAWSLGNLHFPIELEDGVIRVNDDPAIRLFFEREKITYVVAMKVFHPVKAIAHSHGHGHHDH